MDLLGASGACFCARCNQLVDEVEEMAGALICVACGGTLEGAALVHQRTRGADDQPTEGYGVFVGQDDGGALAGGARLLREGGVCARGWGLCSVACGVLSLEQDTPRHQSLTHPPR